MSSSVRPVSQPLFPPLPSFLILPLPLVTPFFPHTFPFPPLRFPFLPFSLSDPLLSQSLRLCLSCPGPRHITYHSPTHSNPLPPLSRPGPILGLAAEADITRLAVSPDEHYLAVHVGSASYLLDIAEGGLLAGAIVGGPYEAGPGAAVEVNALAVSNRGVLATANDDATVGLWDLARQTPDSRAKGHVGGKIRGVVVTADMQWAVSVAGDSLLLWELKSGRVAWEVHAEEGFQFSGALCLCDGGRVVAIAAGTSLLIVDVQA